MLKKFAADALGISDIGKVIGPNDFDKTDADDYVMHEDEEKIYFLIKSKSDEYCFTNRALIHVDGANAVSSKRSLYRYDYYTNIIDGVSLETAGNIDLDIEIKFSIGDRAFSIDVDKKQLEQLKDLYKALIAISQVMRSNKRKLDYAKQSIDVASSMLSNNRHDGSNISDHFEKVNEYVFNWMCDSNEKFKIKDFGYLFEKYINN